MLGLSNQLGEDYNFKNNPTPEAPRPPANTKPQEAPKPPPAIPVVLPSANEVSRVRTNPKDQKPTVATPAEWRGVSALSSLDHNVAAVSLSSPTAPVKKETAKPAAQAAVAAMPTAPVPVVLPSADIRKLKEEKAASPLQPLTSWGGVSSQVADNYNHAVVDSPEVPRREVVAAATKEEAPTESALHPIADERTAAPATTRSRGASRDMALMQPLTSYAGVAASIGDDYNTQPSPQPERRNKKSSKEVEVAKEPEAYPVAKEEEEVDQYAFDIASLKAQKDAQSKGPKTVHHGFSPLSSIHS